MTVAYFAKLDSASSSHFLLQWAIGLEKVNYTFYSPDDYGFLNVSFIYTEKLRQPSFALAYEWRGWLCRCPPVEGEGGRGKKRAYSSILTERKKSWRPNLRQKTSPYV